MKRPNFKNLKGFVAVVKDSSCHDFKVNDVVIVVKNSSSLGKEAPMCTKINGDGLNQVILWSQLKRVNKKFK
jgi:hypothetical protein